MSPKDKSFAIKRSSDNFDIPSSSGLTDPSLCGDILVGEIASVDFVSQYRTCRKCDRKLTATTSTSVKCPNEKCGATCKLKFTGKKGFVKFSLITINDNKEHKLTMFHDEIVTIMQDYWDTPSAKVAEKLCELPELSITKDNKDIVRCIALA